MLVYPTLHYQNGGIKIRPDGSTGIESLFVAGEAAGGIHGSNRLMGNSLLDITVFGRRVGTAAAESALQHEPGAMTLEHLRSWNKERAHAGLADGRPAPILLPDYARHIRPVRKEPLVPVAES
jgi:succinate dehydrogenase/fumarate reductase flavoprotein subunit